MKRGFLICVFFTGLFCLNLASASLGISPAKTDINFVSGSEHSITYRVVSDGSDTDIELYVEGDLAKYAKLDRKKSKGSTLVKMTLKLPDDVDPPGLHKLLVGAREVPREDQFLGVSINIRAVVNVFVPYPGRYVETGLSVSDANAGEDIPIEVQVINRGKESVNVGVDVLFFENKEKLVYTMPFQDVYIETGKDRYFRKFLNTQGYRPGDYLAKAVINYGEEIEVNRSFRIGSLFVNVTNYTQKLPQKGIQKFLVGIESRWNNILDEVYADVNLSNDFGSIVFRTPSVDLGPWQEKTLEGFIDTDNLEGKYKSEIVLIYADRKTTVYGTFEVTKLNLTVILWIVGGVFGLIVAIFVIWMIRKHNSNKYRKYKIKAKKLNAGSK